MKFVSQLYVQTASYSAREWLRRVHCITFKKELIVNIVVLANLQFWDKFMIFTLANKTVALSEMGDETTVDELSNNYAQQM